MEFFADATAYFAVVSNEALFAAGALATASVLGYWLWGLRGEWRPDTDHGLAGVRRLLFLPLMACILAPMSAILVVVTFGLLLFPLIVLASLVVHAAKLLITGAL
jgi:hypothetical protein